MENYINYICIHNNNFESRFVELQNGVNMIVGESKTGKSALVEIIDYCYCSQRCTIPKGIILDFGLYFSLIMTFGNDRYLISRKNPDHGGTMLFIKVDKNFHPNDINKDFLDRYTFKPHQYVQLEMEKKIGLRIDNLSTDSNGKKASMRNMVSYLFQHQNLIASKFALFYRFSDSYKRRDIVEQFPIFAGLLNQNYYSLLIERNELKLKIKQMEKMFKNNDAIKEELRESFVPLIKNYLSLIGNNYDKDFTLDEAKKLAKNLPEFSVDNYNVDNSIIERYNRLNKELEEARTKEQELEFNISNIENLNKSGASLVDSLVTVKEKASFKLLSNSETTHSLICPLCKSNVNESENVKILDKLALNIEQQIQGINSAKNTYSEPYRKLKNELELVVKKIKSLYKQIKDIEKQYFEPQNSKITQINEAKAKVQVYVDLMDKKVFDFKDTDLEKLRNNLLAIENKIKEYDISNKIESAENYINHNMNRIGEKLNFEEEYKPLDMHFKIEETDFKFHLKKGNDNINLFEMGSGANWISCHISLFLSMMSYFCSQPNNCILKTMFFDQPSQVYYSNQNEEIDVDRDSVLRIYQTIFEEVDNISSETGICPQIILVDHANYSEFSKYVRAEWYNGKKLI